MEQGRSETDAADRLEAGRRRPPSVAVQRWLILFSGFLQREDRPSGFLRLFADLNRLHAGPTTRVELRSWRDDAARLAEFVFLLRNGESPRITLYGYSWGGAAAIEFAGELRRRGLIVEHLVLCDAVYRHRYALGQWRALVPWSRLVVPENVRRVTWFRQRQSLPRGHEVVAADAAATRVDTPHTLLCDHCWCDDAPGFHLAAKRIAEGVYHVG